MRYGRHPNFFACYCLFHVHVGNMLESVKEVACSHAFLSSRLQFYYVEPFVVGCNQQMIAFCLKCSWFYAGATCTRFCSLEYLHYASICLFCLAVRCKCGPRTGIRTESTHKVVDAFGVIVPVNLTSFLEYLGCSLQFDVLTLRL